MEKRRREEEDRVSSQHTAHRAAVHSNSNRQRTIGLLADAVEDNADRADGHKGRPHVLDRLERSSSVSKAVLDTVVEVRAAGLFGGREHLIRVGVDDDVDGVGRLKRGREGEREGESNGRESGVGRERDSNGRASDTGPTFIWSRATLTARHATELTEWYNSHAQWQVPMFSVNRDIWITNSVP